MRKCQEQFLLPRCLSHFRHSGYHRRRPSSVDHEPPATVAPPRDPLPFIADQFVELQYPITTEISQKTEALVSLKLFHSRNRHSPLKQGRNHHPLIQTLNELKTSPRHNELVSSSSRQSHAGGNQKLASDLPSSFRILCYWPGKK